MTWRPFILVAALAVWGCVEDQEQALRKCEFSALSTYKDGWQTWGPESPKYRNYIYTCMRAAGYERNVKANKCPVDIYMEHNPYCYQPTGSISYLFWRIELMFDGGSI
jgi:hypothetical protein